MKIDLRCDFEKFYSYLESRVNNFYSKQNIGPGPQSDRVSMIEVGYEIEQSGWIALVFDMREDAKPDGQWGAYAGDNMLEMDHWFNVIDNMNRSESSVEIILLDGNVKLIDFESQGEDLLLFGIMIKEVLIKARESGLFSKLPLADRCIMGVEELSGSYGWPHFENREAEGSVHA